MKKKQYVKPTIIKINVIEITKGGTSGNTEQQTWQMTKRGLQPVS